LPAVGLPEGISQNQRRNQAAEFGKPSKQQIALAVDPKANGRYVQNHARASVNKPAPDKRTQQNILKEAMEDAIVDNGIDHVGRLIGNGQDVQRKEQRYDDNEGVSLGLIKRNGVISKVV
jgi:hypothetical protein